jgi:adiponectin receptor
MASRQPVHSVWVSASVYSFLSSFYSLAFLHNESLNIYTHLIPAVVLFFAQIFMQNLITRYFPLATTKDRLVFSVNILAATTAMTLSCLYHTLMNHSLLVSSLWLHIDYVGILTLILGSFISGIYVGFYCEPSLQNVYWSIISSLVLLTSFIVLNPRFQGLRFRPHRTAAFIATGMSGFAPITHGLWLYGWREMWMRSGMPYWFLEFALYGLGALFFATRIPESVLPGRFDVWGSSHQIFHVLVVIAFAVHLAGVWDAYAWNYSNNRLCMTAY